MSLTLPANYSAALTTGFKENWLFQFYHGDESAFTGFAFADTTVSSIFYLGAILNQPRIRESIDLESSTAKSGNVSLEVANVNFRNDDLSAEIFGTSRYYINHTVKIYSQLNDNATLSNCLQIYEGRLVATTHTDSRVRFEIVSKRPWDELEVPSTKTTIGNHIPVVFGDYTHNTLPSSVGSAIKNYQVTSQNLHPVPFDEFSSGKLFYIDGVENNSSNAQLHVYEKEHDFFPAITDSDTAGTDHTSHYCVGVKPDVRRFFAVLPTNVEEYDKGTLQTDNVTYSDDGTVSVSNLSNIYNENTAEFATFTLASTTDDQIIGWEGTITFPSISGVSSSRFKALLNSSGSRIIADEAVNDSEDVIDVSDNSPFEVNDVIKIGQDTAELILVDSTGSSGGQENIGVTRGFGQYTSSPTTSECDSGSAIFENQTKNILKATVKVTVTTATNSGSTNASVAWGFLGYGTMNSTSSTLGTLTAYNLSVASGQTTFPFFIKALTGDAIDVTVFVSELALNVQRVEDRAPDKLYAGTDGIRASENYTNGASSGAVITNILDAHAQSLNTYAGYDVSAANNIGTLRTARDGWNLRYWALKPLALKKMLEQMQYEGGFIFTIRGDGTPNYIFIPNSPTTTFTLSKDDLQNVQISHLSLDDLTTKMNISYKKHPAESRYISTQTSTLASGTLPRTKWNIAAKENIQEVKLDMLVANIGSTDFTGARNSGFAEYYNQIVGDIKLQISAVIVNPRFYGMEPGDFLEFTNMMVDPFGESWSGKQFIVISLNRSMGMLNFTAREV